MPRKTNKNNIVSPELWSKVLDKNKSLLSDFMEYCHSKDMSHETIDGYEGDIKICFVWNLQYNDNKFFIDFTKRDIIKYQNYIINTMKVASSRTRRLKSAISSMSNFIEAILDLDFPNFRNIINKIEAPQNQEVREKTVLSDEQIDILLNYLVENKKYQQACALALATASGARKAELLRFKVSYFIDENIKYGALYKTPEKIKTKGRSSRGKCIVKFILVNKFKPYFDLWIEKRKELGIDGEELFWTNYGTKNEWKPAGISTLNSWALTFSKILEVDFYFHSCRHYFTTALCKANIPREVIKEIIGWENASMIDTYNDNDIEDEFGKYFDGDGIKNVEQKTLSDLA